MIKQLNRRMIFWITVILTVAILGFDFVTTPQYSRWVHGLELITILPLWTWLLWPRNRQ